MEPMRFELTNLLHAMQVLSRLSYDACASASFALPRHGEAAAAACHSALSPVRSGNHFAIRVAIGGILRMQAWEGKRSTKVAAPPAAFTHRSARVFVALRAARASAPLSLRVFDCANPDKSHDRCLAGGRAAA